jgi:hypothetical protein
VAAKLTIIYNCHMANLPLYETVICILHGSTFAPASPLNSKHSAWKGHNTLHAEHFKQRITVAVRSTARTVLYHSNYDGKIRISLEEWIIVVLCCPV